MSANESNTRGYGRIEDEIKPHPLLDEIKSWFGDLKEEVKEAAEKRKSRRKNKVIFGSYKDEEKGREEEL